MKKLIAGNWKMNLDLDGAKALIAAIANGIHRDPALLEKNEFLVCPSFVHLGVVRHALKMIDTVALGAQNCSRYTDGAYTGDVSAAMLEDARCSHVILGHSERRQHLGESSEVVAQKAARAYEAGLIAIICVGETEGQREEGQEQAIVERQLAVSLPKAASAANTVIAYEPVWAIGTGKTATPADVAAMHGFIRDFLKGRVENGAKMRILYGGSMKPDNAGELLATENVDGGLIGGASLKAESFLGIAKAA